MRPAAPAPPGVPEPAAAGPQPCSHPSPPALFCPRISAQKPFLSEGLSAASPSNSSQRAGRLRGDPEWHGTVASRGCEKGLSSCQPWVARVRKSLHRSSGHSAMQPHGRAKPESTACSTGSPGPGKLCEGPGLLSFSQGFLCLLPRGLSWP